MPKPIELSHPQRYGQTNFACAPMVSVVAHNEATVVRPALAALKRNRT